MLTFPTEAEQVLTAFRTSPRTVSIATLARKRRAQVEHHWPETIYFFDDDSRLVVRGRGRNHQAEAQLP